MKTTQNKERETTDQKKQIDWGIGLHGFDEDQQDVSGGQLGALKEDGDNVVPVQKDSDQQREPAADSGNKVESDNS